MINVGIYVFNEVEILDFCGPYSVFSSANKLECEEKFNIFLISDTNKCIKTQNGIIVHTDCFVRDLKAVDILVIPGGKGAKADLLHQQIGEFIVKQQKEFKYLLSVCTGALILARTGVLKGKSVTTHKNSFNILKQIDDSVEIITTSNVIVQENIVMTAGVLTGIEGALKILEQLYGNEFMEKVRDNLYYVSNLG